MTNTTKDIIEIEKFDRLAKSWGNSNGEYKILYEINPLRVEYIVSKIFSHFQINKINNKLSSLKAIDIGCGGGLVSVELTKKGLNIKGIDAAPNNIIQANSYSRSLNLNIEFSTGEIDDLITSSQKFDIILCLELVEHLINLPEFFINLTKILNPGGMIIISTINRTIKAFCSAIITAEYILGWVPINTHQFKKFIKPSEIQNLLDNNKLNIKELVGLNYNLLTKKWEMNDKIDINYFAYIS